MEKVDTIYFYTHAASRMKSNRLGRSNLSRSVGVEIFKYIYISKRKYNFKERDETFSNLFRCMDPTYLIERRSH